MNAAHDDHASAHGMPGGLAISSGGYTLSAAPKLFEPGRQEEFSVQILDEAGPRCAASSSNMANACT